MTHETHEPGNITGDRITEVMTIFQSELDVEVDVKVQDLLAKAGITDQVISEYAHGVEPFKGLDRIPEGDEQMLVRVKAMDRELTNRRNIVTKICEAGRRPHNMWRNAWIKAEKQYTADFEGLEAPLKKLLTQHKAEQERKAQEEEARKQAARVARYTQIEQLGFTRRYRVDGTQVYFLGETEFEVEAIDAADTETFPNMLRSARMVQEEIQAARAQQELEAQQERERIAQEQEALRQQQAEMARREAEMAAQQERMQKMVNEVRRSELLAMGCKEYVKGDGLGNEWTYIGADSGILLTVKDLHTLSDAEWADEILAAKAAVEERNLVLKAEQERQAAEAAREALIGERVARLKAAGWRENGLELDLFVPDGVHRMPVGQIGTAEESTITDMVSAGQAELARRASAQEQAIEQVLEKPAHPSVVAREETVEVNRSRLLVLLFNIQEVLPYAKDRAIEGGAWNNSIERISQDVMTLRIDLKDETLGPDADKLNELW
jgi:hypothetical protein